MSRVNAHLHFVDLGVVLGDGDLLGVDVDGQHELAGLGELQ